MIQPLRRAHQWIVAGLAVVLPAIFVAGLAVRQPLPPITEFLPGRDVSTGNISEELRSFQNLLAPDLLVYWARTVPFDGTLPGDARLLGSLHGALGLEVSTVSGGYLLAYSLANRRVLAQVAIGKEARRP